MPHELPESVHGILGAGRLVCVVLGYGVFSGVPNCVFRGTPENEDVHCNEDPKGETPPRTALT